MLNAGVVTAVAWLVSLAIGLAIYLGVTAGFDSALLLSIAEPLRAMEWPVSIAKSVSFVGSYFVRLPLAALCVLVLLHSKDRVAALVVTVSSLGSFFGAAFLQQITNRNRPDILESLVQYATGSFPSGHAASAVAAFGAIGWAALRHGAKPWLVYTTVASLVLTIGLSRLVLAAHWPTDIMAGWAMGLGWLLLCVSHAPTKPRPLVMRAD
jgi:undecaprenyl-diphosphatase